MQAKSAVCFAVFLFACSPKFFALFPLKMLLTDILPIQAAHLTIQLREANGELEAKEARLQEALKQRKKAKKAAQMQQGSGGGGGGGSADVAVLENENARLREREQALMDAVSVVSA